MFHYFLCLSLSLVSSYRRHGSIVECPSSSVFNDSWEKGHHIQQSDKPMSQVGLRCPDCRIHKNSEITLIEFMACLQRLLIPSGLFPEWPMLL